MHSQVALDVGGAAQRWSPDTLEGSALAVGATLAGALSYAVGGIYAKRRLADAPVLTLALGQQLSAAVWLLVPALLTLPRTEVSLAAVGAMCALALLSTALAYVVFFWLIGQVGPVRTFTASYVIPLFGALWGAVFLGERPTLGVLARLGCILISLVLVNNVRIEDIFRLKRGQRLVREDGQAGTSTT